MRIFVFLIVLIVSDIAKSENAQVWFDLRVDSYKNTPLVLLNSEVNWSVDKMQKAKTEEDLTAIASKIFSGLPVITRFAIESAYAKTRSCTDDVFNEFRWNLFSEQEILGNFYSKNIALMREIVVAHSDVDSEYYNRTYAENFEQYISQYVDALLDSIGISLQLKEYQSSGYKDYFKLQAVTEARQMEWIILLYAASLDADPPDTIEGIIDSVSSHWAVVSDDVGCKKVPDSETQ